MIRIPLTAAAVLALGLASALADELGGTMEATVDGRRVALPLVETGVSAIIDGDIASVTVRQVFENPGSVPLNATYLFPLQEDAAVHAMTMRTGDEIVRAVIDRKKAAEATFEAAKSEGKAAALLTQHRPNMFTQAVANLMPGAPVTIEITYAQTVPRIEGAYELVVPTVVGPRYEGTHTGPEGTTPEGWSFGAAPAYPPVAGLTIPDDVSPKRLSLSASLRGGVPVTAVSSATHDIRVTERRGEHEVRLAEGRTIPNRDFVLRYRLGGDAAQAGLLTHEDERGQFFSLLIEPPTDTPDASVTPREVVFVLDTSGSMDGAPMDASKAFMRAALEGLRADDAFRIVQFNSSPAEFSRSAVPATARNRKAALAYVGRLEAGGGTEVIPAINQAFRLAPDRDRMRIVVFLSDGYIGYEGQVLNRLSQIMGEARVYAFSVGGSVNRYLLEEMARRGRGIARYVDPGEPGHEAAKALAARIDAPVLTDIEIDWNGVQVEGVSPAPIPDLFAGQAVRLTGRIVNAGEEPGVIQLKGRVAGREASLPIALDLGGARSQSAIPTLWARGQVADLMMEMTTPHDLRRTGLKEDEIEAAITDLGLGYDLVTQHTSFVAVSERVVNPDAEAVTADVPLEQPRGVPAEAYPNATFGGASAPEPRVIAMLAAMLGLFGFARRHLRLV